MAMPRQGRLSSADEVALVRELKEPVGVAARTHPSIQRIKPSCAKSVFGGGPRGGWEGWDESGKGRATQGHRDELAGVRTPSFFFQY